MSREQKCVPKYAESRNVFQNMHQKKIKGNLNVRIICKNLVHKI